MTAALWLCTKSALGGAETFLNGVNVVLINADSAQTTAQVKAAAATAANLAAGAGGNYPATYFDTVTNITTFTGAGLLETDLDAWVFTPGGPVPQLSDLS